MYLRRILLTFGSIVLLSVAAEWYLRLRRARMPAPDPLEGAPYSLQSIPGRGMGAFAKRDIAVSVMILALTLSKLFHSQGS